MLTIHSFSGQVNRQCVNIISVLLWISMYIEPEESFKVDLETRITISRFFVVFFAVFGSDYDGLTIALPFSDSLRRQCVNINIFQDGIVEPEETFSVNLMSIDPAVTFVVSAAFITITDSDSEILIYFIAKIFSRQFKESLS